MEGFIPRVNNVYTGKTQDNTGGAVLYYSPVSQKALGRGEPDWDYSVLEEVQIPGMSNDDFIEKTKQLN